MLGVVFSVGLELMLSRAGLQLLRTFSAPVVRIVSVGKRHSQRQPWPRPQSAVLRLLR